MSQSSRSASPSASCAAWWTNPASRRLRLERLQKRGVSLPRAKAVMRVQLPVFMLRRVATRTILNTGSLDELRASARDLLRLLCE